MNLYFEFAHIETVLVVVRFKYYPIWSDGGNKSIEVDRIDFRSILILFKFIFVVHYSNVWAKKLLTSFGIEINRICLYLSDVFTGTRSIYSAATQTNTLRCFTTIFEISVRYTKTFKQVFFSFLASIYSVFLCLIWRNCSNVQIH